MTTPGYPLVEARTGTGVETGTGTSKNVVFIKKEEPAEEGECIQKGSGHFRSHCVIKAAVMCERPAAF